MRALRRRSAVESPPDVTRRLPRAENDDEVASPSAVWGEEEAWEVREERMKEER